MFRIKNIRSSTVAKHNQLEQHPNQARLLPAHVQLRPVLKKGETQPTRQVSDRHQQQASSRPDPKLKTPKLDHKVKLVSRAHVEEAGPDKNINKMPFQMKHPSFSKKGNANQPAKRAGQPKSQTQRAAARVEQEKSQQPEPNKVSWGQGIAEQGKQERVPQQRMEELEITQQQQLELQKFIEKEEEARKKTRQMQIQAQQQKLKEEAQRRRLQRQRQRQQEREKEAQKEKELQDMMQKVEARRRARQEEKESRNRMEQALAQQSHRIPADSPMAALVTLNDPLAHLEMNEAIMDKQVQMLIKMKFAGYPNQEAIQHQVQELDRINRSYLIAREDPLNPLVRGLANFRIELFNRVGELVVEGQRQMGPSASGLRIMQADQMDRAVIPGVKMTRGLEGHVQKLLKSKLLGEKEQCAICLHGMQKGDQVYEVRCGHVFHKACLQEWLANTANCPVCRYNIKFDHP